MSVEALLENVERHLQAINLCVENKLRMPALVLVYTGIDIFAALNRPTEKNSGTRQDFIGWCEAYLLPESGLKCTGVDLYAARCGIVHSYTADSQLSRENKATQLIYSWGDQSPAPLQNVLEKIKIPAHVVHIESLVAAFKRATRVFFSEIREDSQRRDLVVARAGKFFKDQPREFWR